MSTAAGEAEKVGWTAVEKAAGAVVGSVGGAVADQREKEKNKEKTGGHVK